jgi:hypothetical protein
MRTLHSVINASEALSKAVNNLGVTADQITLQQGKQLNIIKMPGFSVIKYSSTNFANTIQNHPIRTQDLEALSLSLLYPNDFRGLLNEICSNKA